MAAYSQFTSSTKLLILALTIFYSLHHFSVSPFEFEVGGTKGWVVPPANDSKIYNDWASENRFKAGDAVHFKYRKDSVMEVTEKDYKRCNSSHPNFFSNTGNTVYNLNHSGPFYFISGVSGHCERGQRMIVKVMTEDDSHSGDGDDSSSASSPTAISPFGVSKVVFIPFVLSYVASYLF